MVWPNAKWTLPAGWCRVSVQTEIDELVARRRLSLISEIIEHKKNSSRAGAAGEIARIKDHLSELAHIVTAGASDGWGTRSRLRLDEWMTR
jgi:hypothetical protein